MENEAKVMKRILPLFLKVDRYSRKRLPISLSLAFTKPLRRFYSQTHLGYFLAVCFSFVGPAVAEQQSLLTVDKIISLALENSPLVREIEARAREKMAEGIAVKTLENPVFDAELQGPLSNSRFFGDAPVDISLSQPLRPSDFGARERVNTLLAGLAENDKAIELVELSQSLRLLFIKAWAAQEQIREIQSGLSQTRMLAQMIRAGAAQALYSSADTALFDAKEKKLLSEQLGLEATLARTKAELTRKTGASLRTAKFAKPSFPPLVSSAISEPISPKSQRALALLRLAQEQANLAELDSYPSFAPRFVLSRDEEDTGYIGLGISVELPLFNTNQGEKLRSSATLSATRSNSDYLTGPGFQEEISLLSTGLNTAQRQAEVNDNEVVPAVKKSFEASVTVFKQGQGSVFQVFETLNELIEAKTHALELWVEIQSERSEISMLLGKDI